MIILYEPRSSGNSVPEEVSIISSFPVYSFSQRGIFTVPISSHCLWCVHPSLIRTLSPSLKLSSAFTPRTIVSRFPLYLANKIEKDVSKISFGVSFATFPKTWLSVITIFGFLPSEANVPASSVSFTTIADASASKMSRIVCCCGKIRRPFGAALSIGTTSTTKSDGSRRSPTIFRSSSSFPFNAPSSSFSS